VVLERRLEYWLVRQGRVTRDKDERLVIWSLNNLEVETKQKVSRTPILLTMFACIIRKAKYSLLHYNYYPPVALHHCLLIKPRIPTLSVSCLRGIFFAISSSSS